MRSRIGAALMIAVTALLMSGEVLALFASDTPSDYMVAMADGHLMPLVVD